MPVFFWKAPRPAFGLPLPEGEGMDESLPPPGLWDFGTPGYGILLSQGTPVWHKPQPVLVTW